MSTPGKKSDNCAEEAKESAVWDALAEKIRAGDREALAEFFILIERRFRRRFRGRLRPEIRRLHESGDLWATTYLRLGDFLERGGFIHAASGRQLWALALRTAEHVIEEWERRRRVAERVCGSGAAKRRAGQRWGSICAVFRWRTWWERRRGNCCSRFWTRSKILLTGRWSPCALWAPHGV